MFYGSKGQVFSSKLEIPDLLTLVSFYDEIICIICAKETNN